MSIVSRRYNLACGVGVYVWCCVVVTVIFVDRGGGQSGEKQAFFLGTHRTVGGLFNADAFATGGFGQLKLSVGALGPELGGTANPGLGIYATDADGDIQAAA